MEDKTLKIFTDGGSRGNPGHSACAFVIKGQQLETLYQQGIYLGIGTNNNAEYSGVLAAMKHLLVCPQYYGYQLKFYIDSELVVRQLTGIYKIKDKNLQKLYLEIKKAEQVFDVTYTHILRHLNKEADFLVNQTLDAI